MTRDKAKAIVAGMSPEQREAVRWLILHYDWFEEEHVSAAISDIAAIFGDGHLPTNQDPPVDWSLSIPYKGRLPPGLAGPLAIEGDLGDE